MTATKSERLQAELVRRQKAAALTVAGSLILALILLLIAYLGRQFISFPGDPITMGLWIAILVLGLGAFVLRRTKFAALRLKDIAALKGSSGLLKTLQNTTMQCAVIGGAIAVMGFIISIRTREWTDMLRATGVSLIVLIYCYPFRSAWERALIQLGPQE